MVGGDGESAAELVTRAAALNSERMVLVGPDALDSRRQGAAAACSPRRPWQAVIAVQTGPGECPSTARQLQGLAGPGHRSTATTTSTCWCGAA